MSQLAQYHPPATSVPTALLIPDVVMPAQMAGQRKLSGVHLLWLSVLERWWLDLIGPDPVHRADAAMCLHSDQSVALAQACEVLGIDWDAVREAGLAIARQWAAA